MVREDAHAVAARAAAEHRQQRAAVLFRRRGDERAGPQAQARDQRVQRIGGRLREGDARRAPRIAGRRRHVGARRVERGVVRVVPHVREHADRREPRAVTLGGALRDRERRPGPGDVEVEKVAA